MIKFTRYIVVLLSFVTIMTSCVDGNEQLMINTSVDGNAITISGRITAFDDRLVDTRAGKTPEESYTSSMAMAVFPINGNTFGECISYVHRQGTNVNFTIDRAKIREAYGEIYDNKPIAIYLFANMPDLPATMAELTDKTLNFFLQKVNQNSGIRRPQKGFPMVGSLGDNISANADGNTFVLIPTESVDGNTKIKLPELNNIPSDYIPIPLKALYAKFSFAISVQPDQQIQEGTTPTFTLESYTLNNIPSQVYADSASNSNQDSVLSRSITTTVGTSITEGGSLEFDFYLPERFLTPTTLASNYDYPLGDNGAEIKESAVREEDRRYLQRFKPKLVTNAQKATYITLNGYYLDHQNHNWKVSYDIYLGEDNYSDFNFKRNTNYVNNVVIRGLKASKDQNVTGEGVFVDHRVNVERSLPIIINLQRETLLDAHFEVRPLRLRSVGDSGKSATVKILNENGTETDFPDWIRLEVSGNTTDHIESGVSAGKRKYFTTDLVTNTLKDKGKSVTISNLTSANQTVWIYVDENTTTESRAAIVRVTYDDSESQDYKIVQHGLYKVTSSDDERTYYIEQYEEYLYNYDAEDSYGQTKEEGMPWGLPNVQLSNEHRSFTNSRGNSSWENYVNDNILPTYDFYIEKHDGDFAAEAGATMVHSYAGQHFTEDIVKKSKNGVSNLTMDQQASGAVEYCYNRNKRNSDGSITKILWYLPSADELEDFIVPAYSSFEEFQDNYYWTSQPAYIRNVYYYEDGSNTFPFIVYDDNPEYARATKVVAKGNDTYEYALSGLNEETNIIDSSTGEILDFTGSGEINFGYFYLMYRWKSGAADETFGQNGFGGVVNGTQYKGEEFGEKLDGRTTGNRYHVHLGHLYDMTQEGYHHRTKKNRIRCVRADLTTNNQQMVLVYTVSTTPATTLDNSGNTMYVMRNTNTNYSTYYLTTSGTNVAASNSALGFDNYVVIEGNKIKSVAKNQYFYGDGDGGNVSFNNNGTTFTISSSGSDFTISYRGDWWQTYYLKQTNNTAVQMNSGNNGNNKWQFYEVKKEYKVVE